MSESVGGLTTRPAPVRGIALPPQASEPGLIPLGVPWQRILDAYLKTALDSPNSVRAYRRQCARAFQRMGIVSLAELSGELLGRFRAEVVGNPDSAPASKSQQLDCVRAFLKWSGGIGAHGLDDGIINKTLKSPKSTVLRPYRILKGDETGRFWEAAAKKPMAYAAMCCWLGAGLRVSEVACLRIQDCFEDLEGGPALKVNLGKGSKDRIVPMLPDYFLGITNYLHSTGRDLTSPGRVFVAQDRARESRGQRAGITACGLRLMLKAVMAEAGIETFRKGPHALRHTYAMNILRAGGNMVAVSKLLGHSTLSTTLTYVNHLGIADLRAALPGYVPSIPVPPPSFAPSCPPPVADEPTLTSAEVATLLGVGMWEVADLWRRGKLEGRKVSGVLRFNPAAVEARLGS